MADRLIFLGTGTGVPDGQRLPTALLIQRPTETWVLDLGPGVLRAAVHHVGLRGIQGVLITHFHLDHTADLAALFFALRNAPRVPERLTLVGPPGFRVFLHRLLEAFSLSPSPPRTQVHLQELAPGHTLAAQGGLRITAFSTFHTPESQGYRWDLPEVSFAYTGDTAYHPRLQEALQGIGGLITEASFLTPTEGHLTPEEAAQLAVEAGAQTLAVVHRYPHQPESVWRQRLQEALPPRIRAIFPQDGEVWDLRELTGSGV